MLNNLRMEYLDGLSKKLNLCFMYQVWVGT